MAKVFLPEMSFAEVEDISAEKSAAFAQLAIAGTADYLRDFIENTKV